MINPVIIVKNLAYSYNSGLMEKVALRDINLEIGRGSCVAIVGTNGSGKTTLVQHFNGLLRPTRGTVLVNDINVGAKGVDLRQLRQRVGLLFQLAETQLFGRTVFEDVAFGPRQMRMGKAEVRSRVVSALDIVGLPFLKYGTRSPFELSGGERRRIALAGVLAMSPEVLILDEISVGLDGEGRAALYSYLRAIRKKRNVTIVLVSHDMTEVAALADWVFVLYQGQLVLQGEPRTVFAQGERLLTWGLAVPPLSELLTALRTRGAAIPADVVTVDEAVTWFALQKKHNGK